MTGSQVFKFLPQFFDLPLELEVAFFQGFVLRSKRLHVDVGRGAEVAFDEAV